MLYLTKFNIRNISNVFVAKTMCFVNYTYLYYYTQTGIPERNEMYIEKQIKNDKQ